MQKNMFTPSCVIGAAVILFVALNILLGSLLGGVRFDLTQNNLYTLSQGTKNILDELQEPIRMRFFYSQKTASGIPYIQSYASRINGLLKRYADLSDGKITLEFIDPEPFSKEEDLAVSYGVQALPLGGTGAKLYFGLVATNNVDDDKNIPFFDPEREAFIEYDLTRMIYDLANSQKNVVGLLSWIDMHGAGQSYMGGGEEWVIVEQMKEQFTVRQLQKDVTAIPDDIGILMIVHPFDVSEDTQYAIDQFVLKGGSALVFVDPNAELPSATSKASQLNTLFDAWGVSLAQDTVVLDRNNSMRSRFQGQGSLQMVDKLNWLALGKAYLSQDDVVTGELGQLRFISSGHIVAQEKEGMRWLPLVQSSDMAMEVASDSLANETQLIRNFMPSNQSYTLAGRVLGKASSAFPGREGEGHVNLAEEPVNVIIVADTDLLRDQFWVQKQRFFGQSLLIQLADNGAFVINALENLTGSSNLIGLRSRSRVERPFDVVQNLRRNAEAKFLREEQRLQQKLRNAEARINDMQQGKEEDGTLLLSAEQEQEVENFRKEMINTREQLREVQHALHKDIEGLGSVLKFIHIGLIPLLIVIAGLFLPKFLGIRRA